jgi:hypothetical protein
MQKQMNFIKESNLLFFHLFPLLFPLIYHIRHLPNFLNPNSNSPHGRENFINYILFYRV